MWQGRQHRVIALTRDFCVSCVRESRSPSLPDLLFCLSTAHSVTAAKLAFSAPKSLTTVSGAPLPSFWQLLQWPLRFTKRGDEQELRSAQNSPPLLPLTSQTPSPRIPLFGRGRGKESCVSVVIPADPLSRDPVPFRKTLDPGFRRGDGFQNRQTQGGRGYPLLCSECLEEQRGQDTLPFLPSPRGRGMRRSPETREEFARKERAFPLDPPPPPVPVRASLRPHV